jgi:hypothetical protein
MNRRRRILLLGLALVLLAGGIAAALLWRPPSHAEQAAAGIEAGMTRGQVEKLLWPPEPGILTINNIHQFSAIDDPLGKEYGDGSILTVTFDPAGRATSTRVTPPPPVHPLDGLRRALIRLIPALDDEPPIPIPRQ